MIKIFTINLQLIMLIQKMKQVIYSYRIVTKKINPFCLITGFLFSTSFARRIIEITNESNFIQLTINLLNALSLWLNICILDLHIYFTKFTKLIKKFMILLVFLHLFLINCERYLKKKIKDPLI